MQNDHAITDGHQEMFGQEAISNCTAAIVRACRDCVMMAGVLLLAILTTLIVGL